MNKFLKQLLIMSFLFLLGCSSSIVGNRSPSSKLDSRSCHTIIRQISRLEKVSTETKTTNESKALLWEWLQNQEHVDFVDSYTDILKMNLNNDEVQIITKALGEGELKTDRMNYILWSSGQLPKKRARAFKELASWDQPDSTRELKKFLKARKKFDQWEEARFQKLIKDAGNDGNAPALKAQAKKQREAYERLKYACSAKVPNSDNMSAGKNFKRFIMTVGPISVVAGYTVANWQELKDSIAQMQEGEGAALGGWFKQLGYDLSIGLILNYTLGRIFSEPTGTYLQKASKGYLADLGLGVADMFAYNLVFPKDNKEIESRFESLKTDPNFKQNMELLQKRLDEIGFMVKFKSTVIGMVKDMISRGERFELPEAGLMSLTQADLDRPEIQKIVLKAIAAQLYEEARYGANPPEWPADIIHSGEGGSDRFFFYAGVGPFYHLVNIAIGTRIYQTICMGKDNLGRAFGKAAVMHTIWAFGYNLFEFPLRSNLIGQ